MKQTNDGDNNILVQSANVDLGDNFPDYAKTNIRQVASKYFGHLSLASVHVTREGITYRCTVNMQMGALKMMSGEAKDKDLYTAFRAALQKTAKQLRRSKRELREDKAERTDKDMLLREGNAPLRSERQSEGVPFANDEDDFRAAAE
ncbi:ribosome-associated translation inhibitor RaiA [Microvirga sp. BT689]|uniref:ribosome hibernation-promoting factor, HPF/YfiA family n=1 Tax=Microvirga arvi TaxID=2778731 RepID=UPI0019511BFE|nr:ribosome-associated translation inhibitor RaiA [Microvirga arvi]MBM6579761.1 ribosome-associated translation inhibitor RaiA [Microvirga arvi]